MTGVEILEKIPVYKVTMMPLCILVVLTFIAALIVAFVSIEKGNNKIATIGSISVCIAFLVALPFVAGLCETDTIDHYEYSVKISDEVGFKEFNDKYKVKLQEGDIYIVIEQEEK